MRSGSRAGFQGDPRGNKNDVHAGPQILTLMALTSGAGWLMFQAGVFKNMLERRGVRRVCPSCGRYNHTCVCS
jgi:hypothetical protein